MSTGALIHALPAYAEVAAPYAALGGVVLGLLGIGLAYSAHLRLKRITWRKGESLEDTLKELMRNAKELQAFREELEQYLKHAEARLQKSLRGLGVVRFNPFEGDGSGGNQSFSAAFLDEKGSGIVFSAIYTRAGVTSVYAKPLEKGKSTYELTGEEREAIAKATESLKVIPQK